VQSLSSLLDDRTVDEVDDAVGELHGHRVMGDEEDGAVASRGP